MLHLDLQRSRNIEIKSILFDTSAAILRARTASGLSGLRLWQRDTYFHIGTGRLKLRESNDSEAELIYYVRPDVHGTRQSAYWRQPISDTKLAKYRLGCLLGKRVVVEKRRLVFLVGRIRVHIDRVRGAGSFLELEAVLREGEDPNGRAREELNELVHEFELSPEAAFAGSYADLLEGPRRRQLQLSHALDGFAILEWGRTGFRPEELPW